MDIIQTVTSIRRTAKPLTRSPAEPRRATSARSPERARREPGHRRATDEPDHVLHGDARLPSSGRRPEVRDTSGALECARQRGLRRDGLTPDRRDVVLRLDRLEWDVKPHFALNGALMMTAVAAGAQGLLRRRVRSRSSATWAGRDNRATCRAPHTTPMGCRSSRVSSRWSRRSRAHPASGMVPSLTWARSPSGHEGFQWIRRRRRAGWGGSWPSIGVPYQLPTFVTPAFAGHVSGHSTFSARLRKS